MSASKFKILRHRLHKFDGKAMPFEASPNKWGKIDARYLVIHYTAGPSAKSAINWFKNKDANASAHLVIDFDGSITQMVPFDTVAWHAGISSWDGLSGLNQYALGIELVNAGKLEKSGDKWLSWFGKLYDQKEVIEAVHKNQSKSKGWHIFPQAQLEAAIEVSQLLVNHYDLLDVVGHDDIAPARKEDPGPAFPMTSFRAAVMGRRENDAVVHETVTNLNIRKGPGTTFDKIIDTPLPPNTKVEIIQPHGNWRYVLVLDTVEGAMDLEGWVHGRYLKRVV